MKLSIDNEEYMVLSEVEKAVKLKESSIAMRVRFGQFPQPVKLEIRQAWRKSDIEAYLREKQKEK